MLKLSINICFHAILLHKLLKTINLAHLRDLCVHLSSLLLCSVVKAGQEWHTTWHDSPKSDCCASSLCVDASFLTVMNIKPLEVDGVMGSSSFAR